MYMLQSAIKTLLTWGSFDRGFEVISIHFSMCFTLNVLRGIKRKPSLLRLTMLKKYKTNRGFCTFETHYTFKYYILQTSSRDQTINLHTLYEPLNSRRMKKIIRWFLHNFNCLLYIMGTFSDRFSVELTG